MTDDNLDRLVKRLKYSDWVKIVFVIVVAASAWLHMEAKNEQQDSKLLEHERLMQLMREESLQAQLQNQHNFDRVFDRMDKMPNNYGKR